MCEIDEIISHRSHTQTQLVDTGRLGREFEFLMSGRLGYGYKGSRVYACCRNEWCLMGDLIYDAPRPPAPPLQDWDCRGVTVSQPPDPESPEAEADDGVFVPRKLYRGYRGLTECEVRARGLEGEQGLEGCRRDCEVMYGWGNCCHDCMRIVGMKNGMGE